VVAVDHEVRLAELDRDDRREGAVGERALERTQPIAAKRVQRAEVAGERACAAVHTDERVEWDRADAQVPASERLQPPLDLVELEQAVAAAGPHAFTSKQAYNGRLPPPARLDGPKPPRL
jgi:hypothetical protein